MRQLREWLADAYGTALHAYLRSEDESALSAGYLVGREAMQRGLGPMELASAHHAALAVHLEPIAVESIPGTVSRASRFLVESLAAFEMVQRGYVEANAALRNLNVQLETQAGELARANEALTRAQHQKDQLSALLVHDLKNPLSGIMLNARFLARESGSGSDERKALDNITTAARSLLLMVMNLLDISRSEDGALIPRKAAIALDDLCRDVLDTHRIRTDDARITLEPVIDPGLCIEADRDLLRRVIENLLDNAIRHTSSGGRISIEAVRLERGGVEIRVCDDGQGIPAEHRDRVFDKYSQLNSDGVGPVRFNRGLGLLFCKLAVEAHGGTIRVDANQPRGTVFRIALPD